MRYRETYRVDVPDVVDVKAIRNKLRLTQKEFAERFGFSPAAVRDWEQGRKRPDRSTRVFLVVIERRSASVDAALLEAGAQHVEQVPVYRRADVRTQASPSPNRAPAHGFVLAPARTHLVAKP